MNWRLAGKNLTVSGWGESSKDRLHKATIPGVSNVDCMWYNNDFKNCSYITSNMLCAGYPKNRTASHGRGDSGGSMHFYL